MGLHGVKMRFLIYNIAYGTGAPSGMGENILTVHRYLRTNRQHLECVIDYIASCNADVVGLVEVDTGSFRTNFVNQAQQIASAVRQYQHCAVKYAPDSLTRKIPILRRQSNAFLTKRKSTPCAFHYFPTGMKRLVLEMEIDGVHLFLLHLALGPRSRRRQLDYLGEVIPKNAPVVIGGDFNLFGGTHEMERFMENFSLRSANVRNLPTYPSWEPEKQLDFILYSDHIRPLRFEVGCARCSDHLPLLFDFELKRKS